MDILVRKPTAAEAAEMKQNPTWGCGVSKFDWFYEEEEAALILEGEVTVTYGNKSVTFGAGDYVVFPKGLSCVWDVTKPIQKHYIFR